MSKNTFIGMAISMSLLSLAWVLLTPVLLPAAQADTNITAPHRGFTAPNFSLQTPQGEIISLSDYSGQPVLVFFWASWCSICKRAMPGLQAAYQAFSMDGFEILAVNTTFQDSFPAALEYFQTQDYSFTMLLDLEGEVSRTYRANALPTSILVNGDGTIQDVIIGSGIGEGLIRGWLVQSLTPSP